MGRTLPSITQVFLSELGSSSSIGRFRRALRRSDQVVLDGLFAAAHQHLASAAYAASALPFEIFLLAIVLEQQKELRRLQQRLGLDGTADFGGPGEFGVPGGPGDFGGPGGLDD